MDAAPAVLILSFESMLGLYTFGQKKKSEQGRRMGWGNNFEKNASRLS